MKSLDRTGESLIATYKAEAVNRLMPVSEDEHKHLLDYIGRHLRVILLHKSVGVYKGASDKPCVLESVDKSGDGIINVEFSILGNDLEEQARLLGRISKDGYLKDIIDKKSKEAIGIGYHEVATGYFKDSEKVKVDDSWDLGLKELLRGEEHPGE